MSENLQTSLSKATRIKVRTTADGIHLFNRATGTNVLINEIRPSPENFSRAPRQVSIALTNACDLSCEYCYAPKYPANLPLEDLKRWLRDLDDYGSIGIGFGGGEPTLYPKLPEICEFATKETNLAVTLTTHAHRLSAELLQALDGNINFARVSMDGVGSTYEANRGRSFDDLIEKMRNLSSFVPFGINFVVNSDTILDLDAAIDLASEMKAREFLLLPEQATSSRPGIDEETRRMLTAWVEGYSGTVPLSVSEGNTDGLPTCNPLPLETGLAVFAHIDATGNLKRTSYDSSGVTISPLGIIAAMEELKDNHPISKQ
jgi:sulfatase maturation enzyme AslB (radical SAM superfamily)